MYEQVEPVLPSSLGLGVVFSEKEDAVGRRVLVTGATGFLGANLVRLLLERDFPVRVFRRSTSSNRALEGLPLEVTTGDLEDPESLARAVAGCAQVYHLAGAYEHGPGAETAMYRCHVTGTRLLCEAALRAGVERMVICSSSITLPFGPRDAPAGEDDPDPFAETGVPYRGALRAYYETKKAQMEVARSYLPKGLDVVIVHPDFVLGPWDVKPTSGKIVVQMARLPWVPFYPPGGQCFIGARDCAEGHLLAMEKGRSGASYLLGDHNLTFQEALAVIAEVVGRPRPLWPLPRVVERAGSWAERCFADRFPKVVHLSSYLDSLYLGRYRSPERARRELGLRSTPFPEIVETAYRWFRDQGMV